MSQPVMVAGGPATQPCRNYTNMYINVEDQFELAGNKLVSQLICKVLIF